MTMRSGSVPSIEVTQAFCEGEAHGLRVAHGLLVEVAKECIYAPGAGPTEGPAHTKLLMKLGEAIGQISLAIDDAKRNRPGPQ